MIEFVWPPATLSGHAKGNWHGKAAVTAKHREWARLATMAANTPIPAAGDIRVVMTFYPPDKRGDRVNFPARAKPIWDGMADALGINDSRFLPVFQFGEPVKNGKVVVTL